MVSTPGDVNVVNMLLVVEAVVSVVPSEKEWSSEDIFFRAICGVVSSF